MPIQDQDVEVLRVCTEALEKSTTRQMLHANIRYLVDRYVNNSNDERLPEHLKRFPKESDDNAALTRRRP